MARETIPQQTIVTCDACGDKCTAASRRQDGRLTIEQHALDYLGMPAANGTVSFDLCDRCLNRVNKAINQEIDGIRTYKKSRHIHVASTNATDKCEKCGLDLRDDIHLRAHETR